MNPARNLIILRVIILAAQEQSLDKKIRTKAAKKDRLITLARMYGKSQKVSKEEIQSVLQTQVADVVLGV